MDKKTDQVVPHGRWTFNGDVTDAFDDMLERSIPQYDVMRDAVTTLAAWFAQKGTDVVDLGASRGEAAARVIEKVGPKCRYCLCEVSRPMVEVLTRRFAEDRAYVRVTMQDLRTGYPATMASVVMAVLTVQFTPIEYRQRIVQDVYDSLVPGGAFIMVEKVLGNGQLMDSMMVNAYYSLKRRNGYTDEQVERKRLSLEGVLVPVTAEWNQMLLRSAGFSHVDTFWRWMNFAGWVAVKGTGQPKKS